MAVGFFTLDGTLDLLLTVDKAALDIVGDLEIIALIAPDDRTPATDVSVVSKDPAGDRAYRLDWTTGGRIRLNWYDGTSSQSETSPVLGGTDGDDIWIRVTLDVDNGAGGRDTTWYDSADPPNTDPGSVIWNQLGSVDTTAGVTSIQLSTGDLVIGNRASGGSGDFAGKVYVVWLYDGIGGTRVANPDFRDTVQGNWASPPVTDDESNSWNTEGDPVYTSSSDEKARTVRRMIVPRRFLARRHNQVFS